MPQHGIAQFIAWNSMCQHGRAQLSLEQEYQHGRAQLSLEQHVPAWKSAIELGTAWASLRIAQLSLEQHGPALE
jgi:hypothetical protein